MAEKYFPGFEFKQYAPTKAIEITTIPYQRKIFPPTSVETAEQTYIETVPLGQLITYPENEVESKPETWNPRDLLSEFVTQLEQIDRQIGYPRLTMRKKTITFVTKNQMHTKTPEEREWLIQRYGNYIADGGAGDCVRTPNGTFLIRIGYAGRENSVAKDTVMELIGHEYGHTLGRRIIDDPVFEELKANAFANLFFRFFHNASEYLVLMSDVSNVHQTSSFYLEQLLAKGISEEAILAHLTGQRFGNAHPNDYLKNNTSA